MPEGAVMTGLDSDETRAAYRAAFEELMDTIHPGMVTAPRGYPVLLQVMP